MGKRAPKKPTCGKCGRGFDTLKGLRLHETKMHPWVPPPPPPPPPTKHVNFADLIKNNPRGWGQSMTRAQEKSPSLEVLQLGALLEIVATLHEIRSHFK